MAARDTLDKAKSGIARAGSGFAGTGSGLGGTGAAMARRGIGGEGPSLGEREGDFISAADLYSTLEKNGRASDKYNSLSLGLNNADKKYQLLDRRGSNGADDEEFKNYDNPYAAQNEFDYRLAKVKQGYAKGGSIKMKECKTNTSSKNSKSPNW